MQKKTIYPTNCICCDPPCSLKNKQAKFYHSTKSTKARGEKEMPPKKAAKTENGTRSETFAETFVFSKLDLFTKAVLKDNLNVGILSQAISLLDDDLEEDAKLEIHTLCEKKLEEWEEKIVPIREKTTTHYDASTHGEKNFLKSLGRRTVQMAEVVDNDGVLHAGVPSRYEKDSEDLAFLLADMKARVDAIEYEIMRREFEPEKIAFRFIADRYAPVRREDYSQDPDL